MRRARINGERDVKGRGLLGRNAYLADQFFGKVHGFYLGKKGRKIKGIIVARGSFRSKPLWKELVSFDGKWTVLSPEAAKRAEACNVGACW